MSVYDIAVKKLDSEEEVKLSEYTGKVLLVVNVATLWGLTRANYPSLNALKEKYGQEGFEIIGMPCNQFGLQENSSEAELMNAIKYVRPGGGFEPNFPIFGMVKCNGEEKHPLYAAMYKALPDTPKPEHGYLCKTSPKQLLLAEIPDGEVAWNFEKFLIDKSGVPVKRYVPFTKPEDIDADIAALLK